MVGLKYFIVLITVVYTQFKTPFYLLPVALHTPCLKFGITPACPMLATRWLTYLAGTGFSPAGIIGLARPHTPFFSQ